MKKLPDLTQLSSEAKDALIVELWEALQKLMNKLQKTSKNSSLPPSKEFKAQAKKGTKKGRLGREVGGRPLEENPDQTLKAEVTIYSQPHANTELKRWIKQDNYLFQDDIAE